MRTAYNHDKERIDLPPPQTCGESGHRSVDCNNKSGSSSGRPGLGSYSPRPVVCYNCGTPGHRSTECTVNEGWAPAKKVGAPIKMSKLGVLGRSSNVAMGLVNGVRSEVLIDSGAELGSVPRSLVPKNAQLCGDVIVKGSVGREKTCESFMANFIVGGFYKRVRAIIDERVELKVMTKSMVRREVEDEIDDATVEGVYEWSVIESEESECALSETPSIASSQPNPLNLPEGESKVGKSQGADVVTEGPDPDEPRAKACEVESEKMCDRDVDVSENSEEGVATSLEELGFASGEDEQLGKLAEEIGPVKEGKDGEEFRSALLSDDSLREWRELGERGERGFTWKRGALVRCMYVSWEEFREVLVLPKDYREGVMILAHDRNGHLSADKVGKMIGRYFVWPGMVRDLIGYCSSCGLCQRKSKQKPRRAPAVERPVWQNHLRV